MSLGSHTDPFEAGFPSASRAWCRLGKRAFDIGLVVLASPIWVPVLAVCALSVALLEGPPVFFVSERRIGRDVSRIWKFRTMVPDAVKIFNRSTVPIEGGNRFLNLPADSPLYTATGRWLERLGLTELPQLFLVLSGRMSLVGSRPLPEEVVGCLRAEFPLVDQRFLTPAGMTGLVQLVGRERLSDESRLRLEISYARVAASSYSPVLDFRILLLTVLVVLKIRPGLSVEDALLLLPERRVIDGI